MNRARGEGKQVGRPQQKWTPDQRQLWLKVLSGLAAGTMTRREAAKALGLGYQSLQMALAWASPLRRAGGRRWSHQLRARTAAGVLLLADHFEAAQTGYEAAADRCCPSRSSQFPGGGARGRSAKVPLRARAGK
jgi:hypothetical protein